MTPEQFVPTRWICGQRPGRKRIAEHLKSMRRLHGNEMARKCVYQLHWIGIYPVRWLNANGEYVTPNP